MPRLCTRKQRKRTNSKIKHLLQNIYIYKRQGRVLVDNVHVVTVK